MAILSLFISFLGKKAGDILQAVFGWAVTALFGKLSRNKELAVSGALLLSLAWPVFVLGLFVPGVAGWALAFVPVKHWASDSTLRLVWGGLAFATPLAIGGLTHWAAPSTKGGIARSLLHGYPLALGYVCALLITVVTLPLVKVGSIARGWSDEHVYVQPLPDRYDAVLHALAEACARAGMVPAISDVPRSMDLATRVLRALSRGMLSPIVADDIRRVTAPGLQMLLYPADLLLRGEPRRIAEVRAMFSRANLEAEAYLVATPAAQTIQEDLGRLLHIVADHHAQGFRVRPSLLGRVGAAWQKMRVTEMPFEEHAILENVARKVERQLIREQQPDVVFELDELPDGIEKVAARANQLSAAAE